MVKFLKIFYLLLCYDCVCVKMSSLCVIMWNDCVDDVNYHPDFIIIFLLVKNCTVKITLLSWRQSDVTLAWPWTWTLPLPLPWPFTYRYRDTTFNSNYSKKFTVINYLIIIVPFSLNFLLPLTLPLLNLNKKSP